MLTSRIMDTAIVPIHDNKSSSKSSDRPIAFGFHDQSAIYMSPIEPSINDRIILRVRVEADSIVNGTVVYSLDKNKVKSESLLVFDSLDESGYYEYWSAIIPEQPSAFRYHFKLVNNTGIYYLLPHGVFSIQPCSNQRDFIVLPGFSTPDWSKGATYYSVMPDSFNNGDPGNDNRNDFGTISLAFGMDHRGLNDWFGGDLLGIEKKLDYITQYIGASAIAINPVWESFSVAGYGSDNLDMINAHFGTEAGLVSLVQSVHQSGCKIILDAVFAYYVGNSPFFNNNAYWPLPGAYVDLNSPWHNFFAFKKWPDTQLSWGCPVIDMDSDEARKYIYTEDNSIIQRYLRPPYLADGWRFDVGNTLYGKIRNEHEILKDIRSYVKKANPDAIFMSEHGSTADMYDYTLDSKWNYDFYRPMIQWAKGEINQSTLSISLFDSIVRLPRPIALCVYNFLSNHDTQRIAYELEYDSKKIKSVQLLHMTYLGAPCIYYGDETGAKHVDNLDVNGKSTQGTNFDSINWNQEDWNFETTQLYRALCELRSTHTAMRTGSFEMLGTDDEKLVFTLARYDCESKVIIAICQNTLDITHTISARQIGAKEGDVFTNWLTGELYQVDQKGNLNVPIYADDSGIILVKGGRLSSSFRRTYEIVSINNTFKDHDIKFSCSNSLIQFENTGEINELSDKFSMLSTNLVNNAEFIVRLESQDAGSRAAIVLRDGLEEDGACYCVIIDAKGIITVSQRKSRSEKLYELCSSPFSPQMWIKLNRINKNRFTVYLAKNIDGKPSDWQKLTGSESRLEMNTEIYAGITGIIGKSIFCKPASLLLDKQYGDDFNELIVGSLFSKLESVDYSISRGHLYLSSDSGNSMVTSKAPYNDFSVKIKLDNAPFSEGQSALLTVGIDEFEYLKAGRRYQNGCCFLIFAREQYGTEEIYSLVSDPVSYKPLYVQLQRIGTKMAAFWSTDDIIWTSFCSPVHYNASELYAGIIATHSNISFIAEFDYFTFGDYVNDPLAKYNTPVSEKNVNLSVIDFFEHTRGNFVIHNGEWNNTAGGFIQSNPSGLASMSLKNKNLHNLYVESSLKLFGSGWAGIGFYLKDTVEGVATEGYLVRLYQNRNLDLLCNGQIIASTTVNSDLIAEEFTRIVITAINGLITIKCGLRNHVVLQVKDSTFDSGICCYYTNNASAEFCNFKFMNDSSNWTFLSGMGYENNQITSSGIMSWATLNNHAFTNFVVSAIINIKGFATESQIPATSGFHLAKMASYTPVSGGVRVGFNNLGELYIQYNDEILAKTTITDHVQNTVVLAVVDGLYIIFLNGSKKAVLSWQSPLKNGGAFQLFSINSCGYFKNIQINPLNKGESYISSEIYNSLE